MQWSFDSDLLGSPHLKRRSNPAQSHLPVLSTPGGGRDSLWPDLRFFLPSSRWPGPWGDGDGSSPGGSPLRPRIDLGPPLTRREKILYLALAGIACLPFLLLLTLIVLTHSPLIAN
ncbi:MAG: hypothetical protein H7Z41_17720 [Cytophagales bacterium]|nr:hypothetical protein [Armatimonadota bacterium]